MIHLFLYFGAAVWLLAMFFALALCMAAKAEPPAAPDAEVIYLDDIVGFENPWSFVGEK